MKTEQGEKPEKAEKVEVAKPVEKSSETGMVTPE